MMKIRKLRFLAGAKKQASGAALIIALCFLVIICAVVLALYSGTRNDLVNSKVFANGQATILLTDTAVNLVEGQITTASSQPGVAWASQPGMIHAYNNGTLVPLTTTGTHTAYKLYSSGTMVDFNWGSVDKATETQNMEGWKASTDTTTSFNAVWCDLNAPAMVNRIVPGTTTTSTITPVFPIVDPGAAITSTYTAGVPNVQGFGFSSLVPGTNAGSTATDPTRRLAMPVQWIYQLKNGQLITPANPTSSITATFTGTMVPTSSNPIVGRIAFWADDDTCKLNINTASEGTFWDLSRAALSQEMYLGYTLPILGEFQAIGGHPATTSLDPVLGDLLPRPTLLDTGINSSTGSITFTGTYVPLQSYYALNPRINDIALAYDPFNPSTTGTGTTSQGGTVLTIRLDNGDPLIPTVVFKTDRLYATPDELLFNPNRGFNPTWSTNTVTTATLTPAMMAQRDFFITAQSRAPETTLLGTPRICLWPIQSSASTVSNGTYQSARDQLIAFCATTGTGSSAPTYYFQRGQVSSVNGTGQTNPASISVNTDWNIPRNQSIFKYATSMMETTAPGFGSSLGSQSKWGSVGCERMMTMVMDYIRSGLSQVGTTAPTVSSPNPTYWCYRDESGSTDGLVRGAVIPLQVTTNGHTYHGMGRNWSICSAAIQVIPTSRVANATGPDGYLTTGIQAILLLNTYNPMPTPQIVDPMFRVAITSSGLGIQAGGSSSTIGTGTILVNDYIGGNNIFFRNYAFPGYYGLIYKPSSASTSDSNGRTVTQGVTDELNNYPFATGTVTVAQTGTTTTTFNITGGSITIEILEGSGAANGSHAIIQTETLTFPSWNTLPLPQSVAISTDPNIGASDGGNPANATFSSRSPGTILPGDIVGEVQLDPNGPSKGDYRLLTMASTIPANWFRASANYSGTVTPFTIPDPIPANRLQDEVQSLQNRFALAFQNTQNGTTYGESNGKDSTLGNGWRLGPVACAGIGYGGTTGFDNSSPYTNGNNYFVYAGGLISNLKFLPDYTEPGGMNPTSIKNDQPIIPPLTSSGTVVTTGTSVTNASGVANSADWTTGIASDGDGAILSPPDPVTWQGKGSVTESTMFVGQADWIGTNQEAVTEPNRVVASPIILGSLPTPSGTSTLSGDGYGSDLQPWQSLLFCPNPLGGKSHPGFGTGGTGSGPTALPPFTTSPPDHVFCDLFWMPVVEPYAISDPLSTAGKVNLNYEMEPFTHITRRTAMVGVLTPVEIGAISNSVSYDYKNPAFDSLNPSHSPNSQVRFPLNLDTPGTSASYTAPGGTPPSLYSGSGTATGCFTDFENRFASGDVFRSASEVCTIRLVPSGQNMGYFDSWWTGTSTPSSSGYQLTGMNLRQSPYNQIYSRITTKSNTYTVHYWVQSLQQVPVAGRSWATWNENQDVKTGEYRGNTVIERYLDPNTPNIPDYTTVSFSGGYTPIDQYYSWRVVSQKQFAPGSN